MILAVAGTKGSPGVTTIAYGLACLWLARGAVFLVEADPDGGVLAARFGLSQEPGLATVAAAGRHEVTGAMLAAHVQSAPVALALLVAPSSPAHARAALRAVADSLGGALRQLEATVLIDLGRLDSESPSVPLAAAADGLLLVTRPSLEGSDALAVRLADQPELRRRAQLVTVGPGPYEGRDVADLLSVAHAGYLPDDPIGAKCLWSAHEGGRIPRRPLLRALGTLASVVEQLCPARPQRVPASPPLTAQPDVLGRRGFAGPLFEPTRQEAPS